MNHFDNIKLASLYENIILTYEKYKNMQFCFMILFQNTFTRSNPNEK